MRLAGSGLVGVKFFMSGAAFAVSAAGAAKILDSFPCYETGGLTCSGRTRARSHARSHTLTPPEKVIAHRSWAAGRGN